MRFLSTLSLPFISIVALCFSVFDLRAHLLLQNGQQQAEHYLNSIDISVSRDRVRSESKDRAHSEIPEQVRSEKLELNDAVEALARASNDWVATTESHIELFRVLRSAAIREPDSTRQIELYCRALSEIGFGLTTQPLNARLLMGWANIRQLLGNVQCSEEFTSGDYSLALERAASLDSTDAQVKYVGGLVLMWGQKRDEAYKILRESLRYGTNLNDAQVQQIHSFVHDKESFQSIIPPRFPHITRFSHYWSTLSPVALSQEKRGEVQEALEGFQVEAIGQSIREYSSGAIPFDIHYKQLLDLLAVRASDTVRQRLDLELASLFKRLGRKELAEYSALRASYRELRLVPAHLAGDTRPHKAPLMNWGSDEAVVFDRFYHSIGFFLAGNQTPRVIELESSRRVGDSPLTAIRAFVSADNREWQEITHEVKVALYERGESSVVVLQVPSQYYKYWKIHFGNSTRNGQFSNELRLLVRAYGLSLRS